jgi:hypothetical protein
MPSIPDEDKKKDGGHSKTKNDISFENNVGNENKNS